MDVGPGDVEDFSVSLTSGRDRRSPATIRGYHLSLRMFGDYVTDARNEWPRVCRDRFDQVPAQVCHEWNTVAHLNATRVAPRRRGQASHASRPDTSLFPGEIPGKHLATENVRCQLVQRDIQTQAARNAAMFHLAVNMPTLILAEILGLAPHTATSWAALA